MLAFRSALALGLLVLGSHASAKAADDAKKTADRWEPAIAAFEAQDAKALPDKGGIVFVGSSSIVGWNLKESFPDLPVIKRGFGGSQLADSVQYAKRIVTKYEPKTVVLYAGDNDLKAGKSAETVAKDFDDFVALVRESLPKTKIIFIAIKPSPSRWDLIDTQRKTNQMVRERCEKGDNLVFFDIEKPMLNDQGQPRAELFKPDNLHLNEEGYKLWTSLLRPHLVADKSE